MPVPPFIVAFDGPCLTGKTSIIKQLTGEFEAHGWQVLYIPEYGQYAGGRENLPPLHARDAAESKKSAQFLIELEGKRRQDIQDWIDRQQDHRPSLVLVDRLLVTCLLMARRVNDATGYEALLESVNAGQMLVPDLMVFLRMTLGPEEYARRLSTRTLSETSNVVYDPMGYEEFFTSFSETIYPLHSLYVDSTDVALIVDSVFRKATEALRDGSPL